MASHRLRLHVEGGGKGGEGGGIYCILAPHLPNYANSSTATRSIADDAVVEPPSIISQYSKLIIESTPSISIVVAEIFIAPLNGADWTSSIPNTD